MHLKIARAEYFDAEQKHVYANQLPGTPIANYQQRWKVSASAMIRITHLSIQMKNGLKGPILELS